MITPTPVAMVWEAPGQPHQMIAVPGVCLAAGDVLVEVELATICGSDIHTTLGHRTAPTPLVLGHEQVGRIVALSDEGPRADGLGIGDRVVWSVMVSCGDCDRCRRGLRQKCRTLAKYGHERMARGWELNGGFATHVHLRAGTTIVRVGDDLPAGVAAPAGCGTATAVAALEAAAQIVDVSGQVALVTGAGLIGLTATAMLADAGAHVVVADPSPERRALAKRFGAAKVADSRRDARPREGLAAVLAASAGADGPMIAIEASGSGAAVAAAMDATATGGVVVLVGSVFPGSALTIDPESIVRRQLTVRGIHNYAPRHLIAAVDYLRRRHDSFPFGELVGSIFPLERIDAALAVAAEGGHVRVGLDPLASASA